MAQKYQQYAQNLNETLPTQIVDEGEYEKHKNLPADVKQMEVVAEIKYQQAVQKLKRPMYLACVGKAMISQKEVNREQFNSCMERSQKYVYECADVYRKNNFAALKIYRNCMLGCAEKGRAALKCRQEAEESFKEILSRFQAIKDSLKDV